jgi:formylglycine-generating enzyme required for sulfatase activity
MLFACKKYLVNILTITIMFFITSMLFGCDTINKEEYPLCWKPISQNFFSRCQDVTGVYKFHGDTAGYGVIKNDYYPFYLLFDPEQFQNVITKEIITHIRVTNTTDGKLHVSAMNRDKVVIENTVDYCCRSGKFQVRFGDDDREFYLASDGSLVAHQMWKNCLFPFAPCSVHESWARWPSLLLTNTASEVKPNQTRSLEIPLETDQRDFFSSGCQTGNIQGCNDYLKKYPQGELRQRASEIISMTASRVKTRDSEEYKYHAGQEIRDCNVCPEMVYIPSGTFSMGSPESDKDSTVRERPVHQVVVQGFWLGKTGITTKQWDACVSDGVCQELQSAVFATQTNNIIPVTSVTWDAAGPFIRWLSNKTGKTYRLPSEAEWEYSARGGTSTAYYWGEKFENGHAVLDTEPNDEYMPFPVAKYPPNPFGLYDMGGNVFEWIADCWHANYDNAPPNATPWLEDNLGDCRAHVVRGSWRGDYFALMRPASRWSNLMTNVKYTGLRVARDFSESKSAER